MVDQENTTRRLQGRIAEVSIAGFRSLQRIERLQLPQLTVLIGGNGVGKSNVIRFFEMLGWMLRSRNLQGFVLRQGGGDDQLFMGARITPQIEVELRISTDKGSNDYRFQMEHLPVGDTLMLTHEAYRYSRSRKSSKAEWSNLYNNSKESLLPNQKNPTAKTICNLLYKRVLT